MDAFSWCEVLLMVLAKVAYRTCVKHPRKPVFFCTSTRHSYLIFIMSGYTSSVSISVPRILFLWNLNCIAFTQYWKFKKLKDMKDSRSFLHILVLMVLISVSGCGQRMASGQEAITAALPNIVVINMDD